MNPRYQQLSAMLKRWMVRHGKDAPDLLEETELVLYCVDPVKKPVPKLPRAGSELEGEMLTDFAI